MDVDDVVRAHRNCRECRNDPSKVCPTLAAAMHDGDLFSSAGLPDPAQDRGPLITAAA